MNKKSFVLALVASAAILIAGNVYSSNQDPCSKGKQAENLLLLMKNNACPNCCLRSINFKTVVITGADIHGADLRGVNLSGADLSGTNLAGTNLSGANLQTARVQQTNFTGAILKNANLKDATIHRGTLLHGANLSGATWMDGKICSQESIGWCY